MTHNSRNSANENVSNHINVVQKRNDDEYANEIGAVNIELPIIITSSASCCSDTDLLPQANSSITFRRETTLMSCDDNNVDQLTVMRTPSANNLNSSSASRGVCFPTKFSPKTDNTHTFSHSQNVRRWSQSLNSGAKAKQQKAIKAKKPINCMPSRLQKRKYSFGLDSAIRYFHSFVIQFPRPYHWTDNSRVLDRLNGTSINLRVKLNNTIICWKIVRLANIIESKIQNLIRSYRCSIETKIKLNLQFNPTCTAPVADDEAKNQIEGGVDCADEKSSHPHESMETGDA